jgi:SiaC family regulatory phosphoprotein
MVIEKLHILPTYNTPEVILNPEGIIKIKGKALFVNKTDIPGQIMNWIDNYLIDPAETTYLILAIEYINSLGTLTLVSFFRKISQIIFPGKKLVIQWYYEEDDDDILELGKYISGAYNIPIEFIITDDITCC